MSKSKYHPSRETVKVTIKSYNPFAKSNIWQTVKVPKVINVSSYKNRFGEIVPAKKIYN